MESHYLTFRENKVPNIKEYNKKSPEGQKMPLIFLIHDEFADWMLVDKYKNTVSSSVQRLGEKQGLLEFTLYLLHKGLIKLHYQSS